MRGNVISDLTFRHLKVNDTSWSFEEAEALKPFPYEGEHRSEEDLPKVTDMTGLNADLVSYTLQNANLRLRYHVKENEELSINEVLHLTEEHPFLLEESRIFLEKGAKATIILDLHSDNASSLWRHSLRDLYLSEGSELMLVLVQRMEEGALNLESVQGELLADASLRLIQVDLGSKESHVRTELRLGERSQVHTNSIYLGEKKQKLDYLYHTTHIGKDSHSELMVHGALKDKSRKIFRDTIDFHKGASGATGSELEDVTLLNEHVRSVSVPVLLCTEEDVVGNHAASAGQIDDGILYYLMSRGFDRSVAESLIIEAKFTAAMDEIPDEELRQELIDLVKHKMLNDGKEAVL